MTKKPAMPDVTTPQGFVHAQRTYEQWLATQTDLNSRALDTKHQLMAADETRFLRGSFPAFALAFAASHPLLIQVPRVVAIGDAHSDNVGVLRDCDANWVLQVNDVDELGYWPYTLDVVRMACSLVVCATQAGIAHPEQLVHEFHRGWLGELSAARGCVLVDSRHPHVQRLVQPEDPTAFYARVSDSTDLVSPPQDAIRLVSRVWSQQWGQPRWHARTAGTGSLGLARFIAVGHSGATPVVREVKRVVASCAWPVLSSVYELAAASPDQALAALMNGGWAHPLGWRRDSGWQVRRLAPDVTRVRQQLWHRELDSHRWAHTIGRTLAQVHASDPDTLEALLACEARLPGSWLVEAASTMAQLHQAAFQHGKIHHRLS